MSDVFDKLTAAAAPRAVYKEFDIEVKPDGVYFPGGIIFSGNSVVGHLAGCSKCAVMAATLGAGVDRALRRLQCADMAAAVEFDGRANAFIERLCDETEREIAVSARRQGFGITSRFSPGYGDFALSGQSALLALTNAAREAGITVNADGLLLPQKSVTAVIGFM